MTAPALARRAALAAALALACALGAVVPAAAAPSIAGTRAQIEELGREVGALDVRVGQAAQAHNQAIDRLESARARLATTRSELARARADLDRSRERLAERLVALYVSGPPGFVEVLLASGSLTEAQTASELLDQVARGDAGVVSAVRERRARLRALEAEQADAESDRERELDEARAQESRLLALVAERRRVLASARAELRRLVREERERRAREAALARAREAARSAYISSQTTAAGSLPPGDYLFPVAGPTRFTDDWLAPRPGGRYHQGIDLFAARGTPIVAIADGTLYNVGYNGLGGWRLWLRDRGGNAFYFAHLSAFAPGAAEGAAVTRGTVIGFVGDSGDARGTPPHLHFEVHPGGAGPVPPYPLVSAWPQAG